MSIPCSFDPLGTPVKPQLLPNGVVWTKGTYALTEIPATTGYTVTLDAILPETDQIPFMMAAESGVANGRLYYIFIYGGKTRTSVKTDSGSTGRDIEVTRNSRAVFSVTLAPPNVRIVNTPGGTSNFTGIVSYVIQGLSFVLGRNSYSDGSIGPTATYMPAFYSLTVAAAATGKLLYDIRPCRYASGQIGLYDTVNNKRLPVTGGLEAI